MGRKQIYQTEEERMEARRIQRRNRYRRDNPIVRRTSKYTELPNTDNINENTN